MTEPSGTLDAPAPVDGRFYEAARPGSLGEAVLIRARRRIFDAFMALCAPRPEDAILDVGVSDVVTDGANLIERLYPHPERITAAGLGTGEGFRAAYPRVRYDRIEAGRPLPYASDAFPIAASNAVLEHVGSVDAQRAFLREMLRVAPRVFVTVPHRLFPVEHHTAIPFAHWTDLTFRVAAHLLGRQEWLHESNLILMTRARLRRAIPPGLPAAVRIGTTGLPLGPFSSNLYLYMERPAA